MSDLPRIMVMGVGNPLMRDEGAGPRTVEILMAGYDFPDNVEIVDCGTMGYTILSQVMHSLHDVGLPEVLQAASLIGRSPDTIAIGIQIEEITEWVLELSEPVEAALPVAVAAVLEELAALGVEPTVRTDANIDAEIIESVRTFSHLPDTAFRPASDEETS